MIDTHGTGLTQVAMGLLSAQFILGAIGSIITVVVFFVFYFRNFVFRQSKLLQLRSLFLGILSAVATAALQLSLPESDSKIVVALVYAALIEEGLRFLFILYVVKRSGDDFSLIQGVFDSILIGLGFAFIENILYGLIYDSRLIVLRAISSVPIHVFASGIMGFFVSYAHLNRETGPTEGSIARRTNSRKRRYAMMAFGLLQAYVLHAAYDYILLLGAKKAYIYLIPSLIIMSFFYLEYLVARANLMFPRNVLNMLGIDADDVDLIRQQESYEKWLTEAQDYGGTPDLIVNRWSKSNLALTFFFLMLALTMGILLYAAPGLFKDLPVPRSVRISLLVVFPITLAIMIFLTNKVNYLYVRDLVVRMPAPVQVLLRWGKDREDQSMVLDIPPAGVFVPGVTELRRGSQVTMEIGVIGQPSHTVPGFVHWLNLYNDDLPIGIICRYGKQPWSFRIFRLSYGVRKWFRRLRRLPDALGWRSP